MLKNLLAYIGFNSYNSAKFSQGKPLNFFAQLLKKALVFFVCYILTFSLLKLFFSIQPNRVILVFGTLLVELKIILDLIICNARFNINSNSENKFEKTKENLINLIKMVAYGQFVFLLPFFISYGLFFGALGQFYLRCFWVFTFLTVLLSLWLFLLLETVKSLKKSFRDLSCGQEVKLSIILLIASVWFIFNYGSYNILSLEDFRLANTVKQIYLMVESLVVVVNNNLVVCLNIITVVLLVQSFICLVVLGCVEISQELLKIELKKKSSFNKNPITYENQILKSCLARSPTYL